MYASLLGRLMLEKCAVVRVVHNNNYAYPRGASASTRSSNLSRIGLSTRGRDIALVEIYGGAVILRSEFPNRQEFRRSKVSNFVCCHI